VDTRKIADLEDAMAKYLEEHLDEFNFWVEGNLAKHMAIAAATVVDACIQTSEVIDELY